MNIIYGTAVEGRDIDITARVVDPLGAVLVPGDIASYTVDIYDLSESPRDESPVYEFSSSTSSEVIKSSLVTDGRWSADALGYNFIYRLKHSTISPLILKGGRVYRVEVWLTSDASPTNDPTGDIPVLVELNVLSTFTK